MYSPEQTTRLSVCYYCLCVVTQGGTDSSRRMIDRLGEKLMRPFLTLIMLLPGTPILYYGDEIGKGRSSHRKVTKRHANCFPCKGNIHTIIYIQ